MVARRPLLRWLAVTPLGTLAREGAVSAAPALGQVFDGEPFDQSAPGLEPVLLRGGFARRGAPLSTSRRAVFSIANANDRYAGVVELAAVPQRMSFLSVPGGLLRADSWGTGFGNAPGSATFHADRALADELARLWAVPRRDRIPLGAGLRGRFRAKTAPLKVGGPIEIALDVRNDGTAPVGFSVGGRQRGPRDNRFGFVVEQGGKRLPAIEAHDFGGRMLYRELKPGESVELAADLAHWATIGAPGAYRVHCRYEAELVPGIEGPRWPDQGHRSWDLTLAQTLDLHVSP